MFIGERGLKIRIMFRNRAGRPRSAISSGGADITVPSATLRASFAEWRSPAASHAAATNDAPEATPPTQKYSGTSHVHTGGLMKGPLISGIGAWRMRRLADAI